MEDEILSEQIVQETSSRKGLLVFWLRMLGWLATGLGAPIATFAIKFGLFTKSGYELTVDEMGNVTSSTIALNGWGIVSCILIGFTAISILKEVIDAYSNKYSLAKQCFTGLKNKIIPITIAVVILYFLKGVIDQIIFCLVVIGISEIAAIPLNPLPEWRNRKQGEEDYSDLLTGFVKLVKQASKKKGVK